MRARRLGSRALSEGAPGGAALAVAGAVRAIERDAADCSGQRAGTLPRAARMRSGVKGWAKTLAPNGRSASLMAFMTAAGAPAVAAPPPALAAHNGSFLRVSQLRHP